MDFQPPWLEVQPYWWKDSQPPVGFPGSLAVRFPTGWMDFQPGWMDFQPAWMDFQPGGKISNHR